MFERRFTIEITDRPDTLGRILVLCQQRRCQVTALSYVGADRHRRAQLSLTVRAPSWHVDRLPLWLSGLVDVLEVREPSAAAARWCPTAAVAAIDGRADP
jgi:acetolactate synthase regulatory subunit